MVTLPYKLREGQIAYAAKVMANFEALRGAISNASIEGLGDGDIVTLLGLLYKAAVLANEEGNSGEIVFPDGETLDQKFNSGTLNASLIGSDGLFYFKVATAADADEGLTDGHLYVYAAESIDEDDFSINNEGHLLYRLDDPRSNNEVHIYDLGSVRGPKGDTGRGDMKQSIYDPLEAKIDLNRYIGYFSLPELRWGMYVLTYDKVFQADKTYYIDLGGGTYAEAVVVPGGPVNINTYYELLPENECLLTDECHTAGSYIDGHISSTSGHAIISPVMGTDDDVKRAWAWASITAVAQGDGLDTDGAENHYNWIRLRALGTPPTVAIPLEVLFYKASAK